MFDGGVTFANLFLINHAIVSAMPVFFFIILFRNIILSYDKSYDFIFNIYLHTLEILDVNMHPYFKYIFHIFLIHYITLHYVYNYGLCNSNFEKLSLKNINSNLKPIACATIN